MRPVRLSVVRRLSSLLSLHNASPYLAGVVLVGAATLVSYAVFHSVGHSDLTLIFLVAVVVASRYFGLWPSVLVSILSILVWDYFFTLPYYSFELSDERDVFTLAIFMMVALIVSAMTSHIRYQNKQLAQLADNKTQLYAFSEKLARTKTVEEISRFTVSYASARLKRDVVLLLGSPVKGKPNAIFSADSTPGDIGKLTQLDIEAELFISELEKTPVTRDYTFIPVVAFRGRVGALRIGGTREAPISSDDRQHITAVLGQAAVAIERIWLAEEHEMSSLAAETERMRNALLISVSHDLRTPLTSIIGSLSTLETMSEQDKASSGSELTDIALSEAQRLDRFIGNLLDMTKLEFGGLDVKISPVNVVDILEAVLQRSQQLLEGHPVAVRIQDNIPPVSANAALIEQALFNVIDNAAKFSPPNGEIEIRSFSESAKITFQVLDQGEGISDQLSQTIFQKFARAADGDSKPPGTGLGLVIAKGFLEVTGGEITAANRTDRSGAIFTIRLPAAAQLPGDKLVH